MKVTGILQTSRISLTMNTGDRHDADIRCGGQLLAITIADARDLHNLLGAFLGLNEVPSGGEDVVFR